MAKTYCIILVMVLTTLLCKTFPVQKGRSHAAMRARRATIPLAGKNGKWKMGPVTIFSVLSTLKTQDPLSNTRTIWQTICMKQKTGRGMVSIIVPVIVACIALVGALLYATHEPGNPPFTFVRENAEKERMVESSPDAAAPVAEEKGAIAQKMPKPAVNPSPQPEGTRQGGCTSNSNPVFTHAFTDLSMIDALNPIGGIGGGSPGRSYIGVKEGMEAPVYAPVDAVNACVNTGLLFDVQP